MTSAIIFDFGGVLVDWDPWAVFQTVYRSRDEYDQFVSDSKLYECLDRSDRGELMIDLIAEINFYAPHCVSPMQTMVERFSETCTMTPAAVQLVQDLKQLGIPLYGITNWSAETFPQLVTQFAALRDFNDIIVSGKEKIAKPDAEIFALAISRWSLDPSQTLFIDDKLENVRAAEQAGMSGYHFQSLIDLRSFLTKLIPQVPQREVTA